MLRRICKSDAGVVFEFEGSIKEGYFEVIWYIRTNGKEYISDRGQKFIEAEPIMIVINNPKNGRPEDVLPDYIVQRWGSKFIVDYAYRFIQGLKEPGDWSYSYGERLYTENQLNNILGKLKKNPDTRQATCVLYLPSDSRSEDPPCLCLIDFKIRNDKLKVFAFFRSNDMENAYPANCFALLQLGHYVSNELDIKLGKIITRSESAHIYV